MTKITFYQGVDGSLLLISLILGLTSVEEEHEQYLDVIFKEV